MISQSLIAKSDDCLSDEEIYESLRKMLERHKNLKKVLLVPPDSTRSQSGAGVITAWCYQNLVSKGIEVNIIPALGTHMAMTPEELRSFFGDNIPLDAYIVHDFRNDVVKIGTVPKEFVNQVSEGLMNEDIDVEVNKRIIDDSYDLILSIGQVVPHEVVGMANYSKNIFVGCGGASMIGKTHMLGAIFGMERIMGQDFSPVRKVFDYAEEKFIKELPIKYILTVCTAPQNKTKIHGMFIGRERKLFEEAVKLSQEKNMTFVDKAPKKVIVQLEEYEFKTTWVGNKAIYRTRMAIDDGGELIIIAPGVRQCGEDEENDELIRKYGYRGRLNILQLFKEKKELQDNQSITAHLIHGSSDDRFKITYAPGHLQRDEVEKLNFDYMDISEALEKYPIHEFNDGWNMVGDEEIFYISNPAVGLWVDEKRLNN